MPADLITVTGASGFVAKHVVLQLLEKGYRVRGTVRSPARAEEVAAAVRPHLSDPAALGRLTFAELDLGQDEGWAAAMADAKALIHIASPFPLEQPRNEDELIRPAVDGTLRALRAAHEAGVGRVVLTSSLAAISYSDLPPGKAAYDEDDWTDTGRPGLTPYAKSKTLAERAAWRFVETEAPEMRLTAINPGLIAGPPLDGRFGSSLRAVQRLLAAKDPALPDIYLPTVDVRDVAKAHVLALEKPETAGKRILMAAGTLSFVDIAKAVKAAAPGRRVVTRRAPHWLIRLVALFDPVAAGIVHELGRRQDISNARARSLLGIDFIDPAEAVAASTRYLIERERA